MTAVMSGTSGIPLQDDAPVGRGVVLKAIKAMGHTAGLTQRACAMTAHGVAATGRRAGGLLSSSLKRRSHPAREMEKSRTAGPRPGTEQPQSRTTELDSRIGHTVCRPAQVDPSSLLESLQPRASVSTVPNRGETVKTLTLRVSEQESLIADLADARTKAKEARARAGTLEFELASVRCDFRKARNQAEKTEARLSSKLGALQSEKQSLVSALEATQTQGEHAPARAGNLDTESADLREESASAANEHEQRRDAIEPESSARRSEGEAIDVPFEAPEAGSRTAQDDTPSGVTDEHLRVAVFAGAVERLRITKALSDMDLMMKGVAARTRAVKTLGGIPHELSVRALVAQFGQETSAEVRRECIYALTALETRAGLSAIEEALKDEAAPVRLAAVRATYRLAGLEGAPVLVRMLQDEDESVRRRAATCLGWLGHKPLASDLLSCLADNSAAVSRAANRSHSTHREAEARTSTASWLLNHRTNGGREHGEENPLHHRRGSVVTSSSRWDIADRPAAPALSDLAVAQAQVEEARARVKALESDLASVRRELDEARKQVNETQAEPRPQLGALASEKESLVSDLADTRTKAEAAKARAGSMESELASVRHDLQEAHDQVEKTEARLSSELRALQSEKQSLVSVLEAMQAQSELAISRAGNLDTESADSREELASAANENEQRQAAIEQESSARRSEGEATDVPVAAPEAGSQTAPDDIPTGVTDEDLRVAVFAGAVERLRFTKALSDMDLMMKGVAARTRAAKTLRGIPHELSVRALVAQFGRETSAEVRRECICALTAQESRAGLPAVEKALKDDAAPVRLAAVRATYRLAGLEGAPVLARMLQDEDEDIRSRAATCLDWLGHEPLASGL